MLTPGPRGQGDSAASGGVDCPLVSSTRVSSPTCRPPDSTPRGGTQTLQDVGDLSVSVECGQDSVEKEGGPEE